ncbi:HTTM domain-containing protein [Iamia sp. SCSIO 61187]|uniref:HTTM domain-containing protein n=1 Tax=Iamia sp. SCSIO 61187 TaxID=2722752 RepID=UPI001C62EF7D|nr:HTTM domain-containing protein [Iamia sp. SCSIO 61187]QYG92180.1 HTTM domain-containing protein [Iamia sp. SCSIO 61187]
MAAPTTIAPHGAIATTPAPGALLARVRAAAMAPVSGRSLAVVRVVVGAVGLLSAVRIVRYAWIDQLYSGPAHRFTYLGLGWVPQPSAPVMTGVVVAMGAASVALALGWHTRAAGAVLLAAFAWTELIDVTTYLNHYWFLTLVLVLGLVLPWDGRPRVARGWVWLLRFQAGVVYTSAGIAKLQSDWLVRALPLRLWLPPRADLPVVGPLLDEVATAHVLSVAGAAFDCSIVALLLWRRSRPWAWAALVAFHLATWSLFPIGVFPWLMIGVSTIFFAPDWPARLRARLGPRVPATHEVAVGPDGTRPGPVAGPGWRRGVVTALAVGWVLVQVALPLRHLAYPGDHRWTGEGYRFAWNVLLVEKAGSVTFLLHDPATGRTRATDGSELYTRAQIRVMATEPDLIHQAAQALAAGERDGGHPDVEVRVDAWLSFDGRPPARLIDPEVDLAAEPRDPWPDDWIRPAPPP